MCLAEIFASLLSPTSSVVSTLGNRLGLPEIKAAVSITMFTEMKAPVSRALVIRVQEFTGAAEVYCCCCCQSLYVNLADWRQPEDRDQSVPAVWLQPRRTHPAARVPPHPGQLLHPPDWQGVSEVGGLCYTSDTVWHDRLHIKSVQEHAKAHTHTTQEAWLSSQWAVISANILLVRLPVPKAVHAGIQRFITESTSLLKTVLSQPVYRTIPYFISLCFSISINHKIHLKRTRQKQRVRQSAGCEPTKIFWAFSALLDTDS